MARTFIVNEGQQVEKKWNFLWDERLWGKNSVWVEKDGFVTMKLPEGQHFISLLQYRQYMKNMPDDYLKIYVERGKIYYIGDLTFHWNFSKDDAMQIGLAGAIVNSKMKEPAIEIDVKDNYE